MKSDLSPPAGGLRDASDRTSSRSGSGADGFGWNELDYLSFDRFQHMTPAVMGLEIARLTALIRARPARPADRNHLVRARHELSVFIERVAEASGPASQRAAPERRLDPASGDPTGGPAGSPPTDPVPLGAEREGLAQPLRAAILALSSDHSGDARVAYALERVTYIYHRLALIY